MNTKISKYFDVLAGYAFAFALGLQYATIIDNNFISFDTGAFLDISIIIFSLIGVALCYFFEKFKYVLFFSVVGLFVSNVVIEAFLSSPSDYYGIFIPILFGIIGYFVGKKYQSRYFDIIIGIFTIYEIWPAIFLTLIMLNGGI